MELPFALAASLLFLILGICFYLVFSSRKCEKKAKEELLAREEELKRDTYEAQILRELGERFGYELNEQKIVEIIASSVSKLFSYSTIASILIDKDQATFKVHLGKSVSRNFINQVKKSMLASVQALSENKVRDYDLKEEITGTVLDNNNFKEVGSFFNIPIVITGKLAGLINISSTESGLYRANEMEIMYKIVNQASNAVSKLRSVLETEKGKLSSTLYSMSEGVIMLDAEDRVQVINPAAIRYLNLEVKNPTLFDIFQSFDSKINLHQKIKEATTNLQSSVIEEVVFRDCVAQVTISPVKDKKDQLIGCVLVIHDISKEKQLERLREDFTAMMIHELRTPLTAIRGASNSLQIHLSDFDEAKKLEYYIMIEKNSMDMLAIVNDLLDAAKIEAGKIQITPIPFDLVKVIKEKIEEIKPLIKEKKLNINTYLPQAFELDIDPLRIGQVITNLLSNAVKFTKEGEIEVGFRVEEEQVVVWVKDTGVGISDENKKKLFSKFSQLQTSSPRTGEGTGLGLVIAKGIVEAHQGKIWVDSGEDQGSVFSFSLPVIHKAAAAQATKKDY